MFNKNRITTKVAQKTGIVKSKNRSEDLANLRTKYEQFTKNLKFLIKTLTNNHTAMMSYSKSRLEVAKAINSLTVDTPLFKCAGDIPAAAVGTTDGGTNDSNTDNSTAAGNSTTDVVPYQANPTSYAAIHLQLHKKNKMYSEKYTQHVITYASEWERILTTRISGHLKQSEKLRVDLDHYTKKVEDLNFAMNRTMSKGKTVDDKGVDKVKRNEQKLVQARAEYDRFVNDLCGFLEEVMVRGWKDLHPLLVKMAQFDSTLSNEQAMLLKGSMTSVTEEMKSMANKYPNLKPQGRLKELETLSLESLAKLHPNDDGPLLISQGAGESAAYIDPLGGSSGSIHSGLGAAGAPGIGGGGGLFGTQNSFSSDHSSAVGRTSTGDSSGGFDWTTGANNTGSYRASGSAPSSGGLPHAFHAAPSSGGLPPNAAPSSGGLPPTFFQTGSFNQPPQQRSSIGDLSVTSNMLTTMQAAAPPPTLQDIFSSNSTTTSQPPPPYMPPPPPPQSMLLPNASGLSLNPSQMTHHTVQSLTVPLPQQQQNQNPMTSPHSSASSTNPFDPRHPAAQQGNPFG